MDQREQIQISLKDYADLIENRKRVLRSNTGTGSNNQQQPAQSNSQSQAATSNNDRKNDKSSKIKKGSIQEEEPDIQKKIKISDQDNLDKSNQSNANSENQKSNQSSTANWNAQSIQNEEVFEEIFKKFVDLERDPFLDIPELNSTLHGQFYLKDMNKIDAPYLSDSFVKVYSESQNLITISNGFVQQGTNKKKKRFMTIQSQKESKTFTQVCDCSKQDILVLQNIACLSMDYQQFLKHIRPNEKSIYQFSDFADPNINQVLWPVVLLSCYGPLKDNIRDLFTNDSYIINDTWDIFKFGNYRKESVIDEQSEENKLKGQKDKDKIFESQMNLESLSQINFPSQQHIPLQRSLSVQYQQNDVLIWFIGTNRYSIVNMSQLMKMEDINKEFVKEIFKKTKLRDVTKTLVDLIKSYNQVTNRNKEFIITADNCKQMIHRIVKVRNTKQFKRKTPQVTSNDDFYYAVILRFQENRQKQTMQLLIKNLESSNLHWVNLNQSERNIITSLNFPALGPQELKFNYYLDIQQKESINPKEIALSFINRFLLRWFYEKSAITPLREAEVDRLLQQSIRERECYTFENMPEKKRNKERCTVCKYILYNLEFKGCFYCGAYYHTQCIQQEEDSRNQHFACDTCEPCSICHGKISEDNITCCECKTHFHKKCGFSIAYDMNTSDKQIMRWYCESCVQCCICNNKLSDFQNGYSFKDDQIYCNDCIEQLQKKEYCPICKKFWSQETNKDMVQCTCAMWIHRACDPILKDEKLYDEYKNNQRQQYRCTNCRKRVRRVLMCQFIKVLSHLDFQKFFTKNEFEKIPNYLKLIKKPIDLYMMQRKAISGDYDNEPYEQLYKDFLLLIQNALNFNAHHPEAYREATKLNLLGRTAFQYFQNLLKIDEKELITMTEKTSIQGKQVEFIKYVEQNFLNIVFSASLQSNKSLSTIEIYNKQSERQQSNQSQMIEEPAEQYKREPENSAQYQEYLRDVQKMEENNIKQFKYTEVSNLVEQGDAIYNYLSFLQQLMNETNQIVVKFEDICKIFEHYASKGTQEGKYIQSVLKNETLNKIVKYNQYLNDLMNNNSLDEMNEQNQLDNAQSDNSSQEGGVSSQFISFHNALKLEIENFTQKGKPFSFYECVPVKFTNQNINLLRQSCCFMCGAFDGYKSLLFCTSCFESYHPYCLMIPGRQEYFKEKMERAMNNREWNCPKCQVCKVCSKGPNITKNLYCRKCDAMVHFECEFKDIQVWNESKNELYWQCSDCFNCAKCQSKSLIDDSDKQLIVNLDFTDNFTLCYKCGFLDAYYRFCKFCNKYCKKIPALPKPANQQPLDDLFQEKSVRLKYLDQYLEEVLYQCKLCQQVYHKKCFEKAYPEYIQQFFCYTCKESNQSYMQKIYENSLISTKCRIIHIRKVQEFLPIVELIIEKQAQIYRLNRKDIGDFIAEYLHYFESDQFGIYKQNTMAYEKLCQQLRDEGILITPYNIKQMAIFDEKIMSQSVEQLKNKKSFWRDSYIQANQFYYKSEYLFSIAYLDLYKRGLTTPETAELANKFSFDNTNGGAFRQLQYSIFKFELKEQIRYDYRYNENGQLEVIFIENDRRHPLHMIKEDQFQMFQQKVQQAIRERGLSNQSSSQAIQFPSRDGSNQPMDIEDSNHPSEQLIPIEPVKFSQNRFQLSLVYSSYFNQTIVNLQMKVFQENSQYQKSFKHYTNIPLLEEKSTAQLSTVTGINKRRDISQCIVLLQAQEEQLVSSVRQMLDEFIEKKKDKTKISLTQQVLNSYQNFSKNILGSVYQTPMSYQEIITQFREAQKKQILVDNNIIDDPMREIPCQLCSLKGTRKMCGRLLNFDVDKWVHANCALWSTEVKENIDGALKNFIPAYKKSLQVQCKHCNKFGATISCMIASCKDKYHFPCLLKSNGFMTDQKTVLCKSCWDIILKNDDTEIILKMQYLKLVNNFNTDRRIFISLTKQEGGNIDFSGECYNRFGSFILVNLDTQETNDDEFFSSYFFMRYIRPFVSQKYQSYVTAFWLKKKKDEYILKSCLLAENNKIFLQSKSFDENKNEFSIDKDRPFTNDISGTQKNLAGYKEINEANSNIPRFTNNVLKDKDIFNHEQLDCFTSLKGIQQLLQEKINQIYQRYKSDQPNKSSDVNKFVMEYIGFGIPQIVKACQQSSKQNKNNNIFQNIQNIKVNSFQELFYKEQVENFNPFEKQKLLEKMHPTIIQNQKQQQSLQNLAQQQMNQQSSHLNIPILQHLSHQQQGFVHFQKQSQKPIMGNNYFIRPDDIMLEANPDYMKQDTRQTIREKEIEKKIKAEYPNYINSKKRHLNIYAGPSKIHKYGLFAKTYFKQDDIVVEYLGETIRQVLADYREKIYKQRGFGDCYMFKACPDKIIDATFKGNEARYLNHSCNPNCSSLVIEYEKDSKIIIYAKRDIKPGEELTYDYCFDIEEEKINCNCNDPNCTRIMN
ncbi:hypothetical protein ABPG73_004782 [Tetrahymena malaccensis]